MKAIISTLASWCQIAWRSIQEAASFYWRFLTNQVGLPRWLWMLSLVAIVVNVTLYVVTGK